MASVKTLTLSTTPLAITVKSPSCDFVLVKENPDVLGGVTKKLYPSATPSGSQDVIGIGGTAPFYPAGNKFSYGDIAGYVAIDSGTTDGLQVEVGGPSI